jgi:PadR family transcriptional regulator, regulatory protein AphA
MPETTSHSGARSPEFALLGFLYEQPNHGYNLHQQLVSELGHVWRVSQSQTYNILNRLVEQGYVSSSIQKQKNLPPRQLLRITPAGRHRFEEWLQAHSGSSVRSIRLEFITRLYFSRKLFPEMIPAIFKAESDEVDKAIRQLEAEQKTIPREQTFNRLGQELRIRQLHSVREWLATCQKEIRGTPRKGKT